MAMLRFPSLTGKATDRKAWYKASHAVVGLGQDEEPGRCGRLINWWVNSTDAADINLAERGIPATREIQAAIEPKLSKAQQTVSKYIEDIKPELARHPDRPAARRWHVRPRSCSAT